VAASVIFSETGAEHRAASLTYERADGKHVPAWLEAWSRETPDRGKLEVQARTESEAEASGFLGGCLLDRVPG
jgi:hypothetical protein